MLDGIITDLRYKVGKAELKIRTGNKELRYFAAMSIQQYARLSKRQECKYETNGDLLMKLEVDGEEILVQDPSLPKSADNRITESPKSAGQQAGTRSQSQTSTEKAATAPYNFVPINDMVVNAPVLDNEIEKAEYRDENGDKRYYDSIPSFKRYHKGLYHGSINLDIETLTPGYIRDTYTLDEEKRAREAEKKGGKWENPEFFSPGGMHRIPGSSLRGMTRILIEIMSCSRMEYVDDSTLYFRSLADKCRSLRNEYFNIMGRRGGDKKNPAYKFCAGYLQRTGHEYQIRPARSLNGKQYKRTPKLNTTEFSWYWQEDGSCITVSGSDPKGNKTKDWLIYPVDNNAQSIRITAMDRDAYSNDSNRLKDKRDIADAEKQDGDLLRCLNVEEKREDGRNMVPCFYVTWTEPGGIRRVAFGHTAYFRLPYNMSIKQHLPIEHLNNDEDLDLTTAIFGEISSFSGRVFFEDALINNQYQDKVALEETTLKILSSPKPTSFQHYLEQSNRDTNSLLHWNNAEGLLRGYKMYWHRKTPQKGENSWEAALTDVERSPSQYTQVKTIDTGAHFNGGIRFENLSAVELGALLFALDLPDGCAHKIGMGKPLGLGSIRIKPTLTLSVRTDKAEGRYGRLFAGQKWHLANEPGEVVYFKDCFAEYMLGEINRNKVSTNQFKDYWNTERMKELRAMLDFDSNTTANKWLERTRYMEIERNIQKPNGVVEKEDEFNERPVLSHPLETIKLAEIKYE